MHWGGNQRPNPHPHPHPNPDPDPDSDPNPDPTSPNTSPNPSPDPCPKQVRAAAWRLLSLNNYVAALAVNAALRSRLVAWRGELRGAIAVADAALVCKLFLEFLGGLVEGHLRSRAEKECVSTALDKLRGGGTRAHHLAAADLGVLVNRCWSEFGARVRQMRETSSKRRAPYLLQERRKIHKRVEEAVKDLMNDWDSVPRSGGWGPPRQGAVTLPTAPLLALEELRELRKRGVAALSLTTPQVTTAPSAATTPRTPATPAPTVHGPRRRSPSMASCTTGPTSSSCRTGRPRACSGSSSHCSAAPRCPSASRRTPSSASTPR